MDGGQGPTQYGARGHMTSRVCPFETPSLSHFTSLSDRAQQQSIRNGADVRRLVVEA
jgi:hypothetical protein